MKVWLVRMIYRTSNAFTRVSLCACEDMPLLKGPAIPKKIPEFCPIEFCGLYNDIMAVVAKAFGHFLASQRLDWTENRKNIWGKIHFMNIIFLLATKLNTAMLENYSFRLKWPDFEFHWRPADLMFHLETRHASYGTFILCI